MLKKIILSLILATILIGAVSAVSINDFKLPDGFTVESEYWASNDNFGLSITEYNDDDYDYYFTNTSDYLVVTAGNITNYTDHTSSQVGCDEVIILDGEKLLIECYHENPNRLDDCYSYLLEFNKLNNVEPISV